MLALRSRGLGSAWTTLSLLARAGGGRRLGVPCEKWTQVGLFPIAYTVGTDFRDTPRRPGAEFALWNDFSNRP